jgi:hypothetical protein
MENPFDFRSDEQIAKDLVKAAEVLIAIEKEQSALPNTASNYSKVSDTNIKNKKNKVINQGW